MVTLKYYLIILDIFVFDDLHNLEYHKIHISAPAVLEQSNKMEHAEHHPDFCNNYDLHHQLAFSCESFHSMVDICAHQISDVLLLQKLCLYILRLLDQLTLNDLTSKFTRINAHILAESEVKKYVEHLLIPAIFSDDK